MKLNVVVILAFMCTLTAFAQTGNMVSVHGFGGWAAGKTDNDNYFQVASPDWELNNYYFSLNVNAQPAEDLTVVGQMFWKQQGHKEYLDLDYAFAQYYYAPELIFRIGKIKSPFGLYAEIYDVGTLRPFYLLPVGMYGTLFPKSYVGLGITGEWDFVPDWALAYDVVGGEMSFTGLSVEVPSAFDFTQMPPVITEWARTDMAFVGRDFIGVNASILTPISGLKVGGSYMSFRFHIRRDEGPREEASLPDKHYMYTTNIEYLTDEISFRNEFFWMGEDTKVEGGYVELAYMFFGHLQAAIEYDWFKNETPSTVEVTPVESLLEHKSTGFGLNYWFNPNFVIKANYYMIDGNSFAQPASVMDYLGAGNELQTKTNSFVFGTQFTF